MLQLQETPHSQRRVHLAHHTRSEESVSSYHDGVRGSLEPCLFETALLIPTSYGLRFYPCIFRCARNWSRSRLAWLSNSLSRVSSGGPRGLVIFLDFRSSTK